MLGVRLLALHRHSCQEKKSEEGYQCAKTAKQEGLQHDGTASEEDDIHDTAVYKEEKKGENGPLMYLVVPRR